MLHLYALLIKSLLAVLFQDSCNNYIGRSEGYPLYIVRVKRCSNSGMKNDAGEDVPE